MISVLDNALSKAKHLLELGANPDAENLDGNTALMNILGPGSKITKDSFLIENGANVNYKNKFGKSLYFEVKAFR